MRLALGLGTRPANTGQSSTMSSPVPAPHDTARQRRRFAQDGDVPVVMLHRSRDNDAGGENKLAALTADLREERAARLKSDRALDEANAMINSLKTKLKHSEMTLEEKLRRDNEARAEVDALLVAEREARQQAEARAAEAVLALSMLERKIEAANKQTIKPHGDVEAAAALPTPDLFGEPDPFAAAPAGQKRRMSKKTGVKSELDALATGSKQEKAPGQTAQQSDDADDKPIEWWLPSFRATRKAAVRRKRATS